MNKLNNIVIKILFITFLTILVTTYTEKVFANAANPHASYRESLSDTNDWCCAHGDALWGSRIVNEFKDWFPKEKIEAAKGRIVDTDDFRYPEDVIALFNRVSNGGSGADSVPVSEDEFYKMANTLGGMNVIYQSGPMYFEIPQDEDYEYLEYELWTDFDFGHAVSVKLDPYYSNIYSGYGDASETYIANKYYGYDDKPGQSLWWKTATGQSQFGGYSALNIGDPEWGQYLVQATGEANPRSSANGFNIHYDPKWVTGTVNGYNYDDVKVIFDNGAFIIGPFAIDYIDGGQYAGITGYNVEIDGTLATATIINCESMIGNYPAPNTPFYLRLENLPENAERVTNIHFDFKYDNAYTFINAYDNAKDPSSGGYTIGDIDFSGRQTEHFIQRRSKDPDSSGLWENLVYYVKYDAKAPQPDLTQENSQALCTTDSDWWTNYTSLDRQIENHFGLIKLEKVVIDEEGKEISLADLGYSENNAPTFTIRVENAGNADGDYSLIPGKSVLTKTGTPGANYKITEINIPNGFKFDRVETSTNYIPIDGTANVKVVNKATPKEGKLQIVKKIEESKFLNPGELNNQDFKFDIEIIGNYYKVDDKWYRGGDNYKKTVTASANNPFKLDIRWYGEAPKYIVKEVEDNDSLAKIKSIVPNSGTDEKTAEGILSKGQTVIVTATNTPIIEKGQIKIIKKVNFDDYLNWITDNDQKENAKKILTEGIRKHKFKFDLTVDTYFDNKRIELDGSLGYWEGNFYVIEKTVDTVFYWAKNKTLNYTLEEIDDDKTEFVNANEENNKVISGTLKAGKDALEIGEVTNEYINKIKNVDGNLEIQKIIDDIAELKDKTYNFKVTIKGGSFSYNGTYYTGENGEDVEIQLTNDGAAKIDNGNYDENKLVSIRIEGESSLEEKWNSETISWCTLLPDDKKPYYKVEEYLAGTDIEECKTIKEGYLNPTGSQEDDKKKTTVYVKNTVDEAYEGKIGIIKKISDEQKELLTIKDIKEKRFLFEVKIYDNPDYSNDYKTEIIELNKNNYIEEKGIWVYVLDKIQWKEEDGTEYAPSYLITELDESADTKFKEANGYYFDGDKIANDSISKDNKKSIFGIFTKELIKDHIGENDENDKINDYIQNIDKLVDVTNLIIVENECDAKYGKLVIDKRTSDDSLKDTEFKFKVTIKGAFKFGDNYNDDCNGSHIYECTVKGNEKKEIANISWYGNAPTYVIEEIDDNKSETDKRVFTGTFLEGQNTETVEVITNFVEEDYGYLQIKKEITNGKYTGDERFEFKISVKGYEPYVISIGPEETSSRQKFTWKATEQPPNYKVEEINIPDGFTAVDNNTIFEGQLENQDNHLIKITCNNIKTEHEGYFEVKKIVQRDKEAEVTNPAFPITVTVSGNFEYNGTMGQNTKNYETSDGKKVLEFTVNLTGDQTFTSNDITWYGEDKPVVNVYEDLESNASQYPGWKLIEIANNNVQLKENTTTNIYVENYKPRYTLIDFSMKLGGNVWEDYKENEKNKKNRYKLGTEDKMLQGIKVWIYKGDLEATLYNSLTGAEVKQPIITNADGRWEIPRVKIDKDYYNKYNIKFEYDGQTYQPIEILQEEGGFEKYKSNNTSARNKFANTSMAIENADERKTFNNKFKTIEGYTAIDANGDTIGKAIGSDNKVNYVNYKTKKVVNNGKRISELQTLNSDGTVKDLFKMTATTGNANLRYGFDNQFAIYDQDVDLNGVVNIHATATYDYLLHINLGLEKRDDEDLNIQKDLTEAKVIVNDRMQEYKFTNNLSDITNKDKYVCKLGLYKTDFYFRAEMYKASDNYNAINNFYANNGDGGIDTKNLEIYLTYKIRISNEGKHSVKVNKISDYYESSLELVTDQVTKYIKTDEDKEQNNSMTVAVGPYIDKDPGHSVKFDQDKDFKNVKGSDGISYNKLIANLNSLELSSGASKDIYLTMKAKYDTMEEILTKTNDGTKLITELRGNQKSNIVEISSYSTDVGKFDKDSAPDNIDIINKNETSWYEDDTDEAPILELGFNDNNREIKGTVWEDKKNATTGKGDSKYDKNDDATIGGLTTQIIEKVKLPNGGNTYTDYDFVWPTNIPLDSLGGKTIEEVTGFSSTTETKRETVDEYGEYVFESVPTGNYVIRFWYGNNKLDLEDTSKIKIDPPKASNNIDGFNTANHNSEDSGKAPAVYNGQDYQAVPYQTGFSDGLITNEWHDMDMSQTINKERVNDARDSESRRLKVIANSQTITNVNGTVMRTADDVNASHTDLYNDYAMYADTAKLNLNVGCKSVSATEDENRAVYANKNSIKVSNLGNENYQVINIDFGLIERPKNITILDKEISEIKIITSDKKVIFDALYNTEYQVRQTPTSDLILAKVGGKYLVANTTLDKDKSIGSEQLQALNKKENKTNFNGILSIGKYSGIQNFRYINIDDQILQGSTIELKYKMTALNVSEENYISQELANIDYDNNNNNYRTSREIKSELLNKAKEALKDEHTSKNGQDIISNNAYQIGKYLGQYYYRFNKGDVDVPVTTKVRQLVDYVDNDATFKAEDNQEKDSSWRTTTITELNGNGYEENRLIAKDIIAKFELLDKNGKDYISDENKNIILSIDDQNAPDKSKLNNKGFEKKLVPYVNENSEYKSEIGLAISKVVSSEDQANNLAFDNVGEIVAFENTAGRRNITSVPGNVDPKKGEFTQDEDNKKLILEIDSSATELITFLPPTGIQETSVLTKQIVLVFAMGLVVIVGGIVLIKKKILK